MHSTILTTIAVLATAAVFAAERLLPPESTPVLRIKKVTVPDDRTRPLSVTFEMAARGTGAFTVAQQQFSLHISTPRQPYLFVSDLQFSNSAPPRLFAIEPHTAATLTVTSSTNRDGVLPHIWSALKPGKYSVRVYINGGKTRDFDYQWLGQTYSDEYELTIR